MLARARCEDAQQQAPGAAAAAAGAAAKAEAARGGGSDDVWDGNYSVWFGGSGRAAGAELPRRSLEPLLTDCLYVQQLSQVRAAAGKGGRCCLTAQPPSSRLHPAAAY